MSIEIEQQPNEGAAGEPSQPACHESRPGEALTTILSESALRRKAKRLGLLARKMHSRGQPGHEWVIIEPYRSSCLTDANGSSLEQVADFLEEYGGGSEPHF